MKRSSLPILLLAMLPAAVAQAADLVVDAAQSHVAVDVKASPPHRFTCDLQAYDAAVQIDPDNGDVLAAEFTFLLTDLETHNDSRNEKMHKWMDVEQHNTIRWRMTTVESVGDQLVAHGEMTMHGVTVPVDVAFTVGIDDSGCVVQGNAEFSYMDFGLPKIRLFLFTVNPELNVHFELRGALLKSE